MKISITKLALLFTVLVQARAAFAQSEAPVQQPAQKIIFPEDELPAEVVLPVLDRPDAVVNPIVTFDQKIEWGAQIGYTLDDPYFDGMEFSGQGFYHMTPHWALGGDFRFWQRKLSSYSAQFKNKKAESDFTYAPSLKTSMQIQAQYLPYYGKVSFGKGAVLPHTFFVVMGGGLLGYEKMGKMYPVVSVGFGQNFYFTPKIALKYQFDFWLHQSPDQVWTFGSSPTTPPTESSFATRNDTTMLLSVGASGLF